jgi:hypothetical protein
MLIYTKMVLYQPGSFFYLHYKSSSSPQTHESYLANDAWFKYEGDQTQSRAPAHSDKALLDCDKSKEGGCIGEIHLV